MKPSEQSILRSRNERAVLQAIFHHGQTSRAALSRELGLSKPAVSDNLAPLLDAGIVREEGALLAGHTRGRTPVAVRFREDYRHILAIELGYRAPIFALGDLRGQLLEQITLHVEESATHETRKEVLLSAVSLLLSSRNLQNKDLCSVAISSPGVFRGENAPALYNRQIAPWLRHDIFSALSHKIGVPFFIKNDANIAALGEFLNGAGQGARNMLYVTCGLGVGSGLLLDGKLFEGVGGAGGEMYKHVDARMHHAGTPLESCVSVDALLERVRNELGSGAATLELQGEELQFADLVAAYQANNPYLTALLRELFIDVGCATANIANLLTMDTVVLGGEYTVFDPLYSDTVRSVINQHCPARPRVESARLGRTAGVYGLFGIAREKLFDKITEPAPPHKE